MDPSYFKNESCCNESKLSTQMIPSFMIGISSINNHGIEKSSTEQKSASSFEINAGASLSDDSGVPLTTNSSISSGDSFQLGMCKFENDVVQSDGEASQFDSLDNCSEGGMSAENFNTLKKVPLPPIDPPPEFQDSPRTTLIRSVSNNIEEAIRRWPFLQSCYVNSKVTTEDFLYDQRTEDYRLNGRNILKNASRPKMELFPLCNHLYSSDSILNTYSDNIYDEPNNIISTSLNTSIDVIGSDSSCQRPTICKITNRKNSPLKKLDKIPIAVHKITTPGPSEMHCYDLCYKENKNKKNTHLNDNNLQRKQFQNPLSNSFQYRSHHYHTGINLCGNRPHSRNSLNNRFSSSHNSLRISTTNKADDSIFITQAMSHDTLITREISDFYNVPIDSDIYAFPIDMIRSGTECAKKAKEFETIPKEIQIIVQSNDALVDCYFKCNGKKSINKNSRNKRRKQANNHLNNISTRIKHQNEIDQKTAYKIYKKNVIGDDLLDEPLHMTFEEVKQFYHTLYSDKDDETNVCSGDSKDIDIFSVNKTIWKSKFNAEEENIIKDSLTVKSGAKYCLSNLLPSDNHNNQSNTNLTILNHSNHHHKVTQVLNVSETARVQKPQLQTDKKTQFTLNLKQKLCSIFRFRRSHNQCQNSSDSCDYISNTSNNLKQSHILDDKKSKFQSRALPPLPKKAETRPDLSCGKIGKKPELQSYHFTSSIEKVKDYGWYWGPLSSEAAEKVLSTEPDGSFLVRDSSDDHYIFSLSFKLNSCVRHVRIEQDQGTFSFGSYAKFKSQTITEFIEKAVEHSRSGRYLFFLHRRPEHGPMRVQLTNPVSRFKYVQSLQHICRFVILKAVIRKDLIQVLPLPRRLLDYLNYRHCYSEQIYSDGSHSQMSSDGSR